jgi:hypothetical protein
MKAKSVLLVLAFAAVCNLNAWASPSPNRKAACDFQTDMRKLWEDHITWTRNVILNVIDNLPGTNQAVARLLQNQVDIGNAFAAFYGQTVGDSIASLFTIHITTAADLLVALKTGDSATIAAANAIWYENGEDIVAYLVSINPHYDETELDAMMDMHLDLTAGEAVARLNQDYDADIAAYDAVHDEALAMSDFLANGIMEQFPKEFKGNARMSQSIVLSDAIYLGQNHPNPFVDRTTISYTLPENVQSARIEFHDITGRIIKTMEIENRGDGDILIYADYLSRGVYTYHIIADGVAGEMKKMMH